MLESTLYALVAKILKKCAFEDLLIGDTSSCLHIFVKEGINFMSCFFSPKALGHVFKTHLPKITFSENGIVY